MILRRSSIFPLNIFQIPLHSLGWTGYVPVYGDHVNYSCSREWYFYCADLVGS